MFCPVKERVRDDVRDEGAVPNARPTQIATGQPVPGARRAATPLPPRDVRRHAPMPRSQARAPRSPGFEDEGLTWEDTMDVVTINMPISADILRSLAVHTDGSTLSLSWHRGEYWLRGGGADATVLMLGLGVSRDFASNNASFEGESNDRLSVGLPAIQQQLLEAVAAACASFMQGLAWCVRYYSLLGPLPLPLP